MRQLEGAVNRLSAQCRLIDLHITEEIVEKNLREMLQHAPLQKITVEQILQSVATIFQVRVSDLKGTGRTKEIALPTASGHVSSLEADQRISCRRSAPILAAPIRPCFMPVRILRSASQKMRSCAVRSAWSKGRSGLKCRNILRKL